MKNLIRYYFFMSLNEGFATLFYSFLNSRQVFRISPIDVFVFLFTGSIFLSTLAFSHASGNATRLEILALLLVLYFCLRLVLAGKHRQLFQTLSCFIIIITGLAEAVWGLMQLYGILPSQHNLFKITGSFFNPGPYAGYLAVVFPLALHFFWRHFGLLCFITNDEFS